MNHFHVRDDELWCEEVPLRALAQECGTPLYVYSHATLQRHFAAFDGAFADVPHLTCYAVKANSNLALLGLLAGWGAGMDVVSGGELFRALRAGCDPKKIVYAGVGKTAREIAEALRAGILMFNVESLDELRQIDRVAGELGLRAPIALRVNPAIDPLTHKYIATGLKESKFGIEAEKVLETYREALTLGHVDVVGIHCHIGSQITQVGPFRAAVDKIAELVREVRALGADLRHVDIGGGLGINYNEEEPPEPGQLSAEILPVLREIGATVVTEPGRVIVGNAGALIARVIYRKYTSAKSFLIVDAGMNDLVRPSLYGSYHRIVPLAKTPGTRWQMDVVGPICESGDFLAKDRELPAVPPGECVAVLSAGAYGFAMSSNYNSRPRAAEVLVRGGSYAVIRAREGYEDLVRGEAAPAAGPLDFRAPAAR
ncbi:MAG TPA: diaminopimelate decarboxylase [bacterium]